MDGHGKPSVSSDIPTGDVLSIVRMWQNVESRRMQTDAYLTTDICPAILFKAYKIVVKL